jgi:hypothetical protein
VQHFRPDFYLPGFGLYIEITTLSQKLVTKKNRKVRRLRELYPDVRIKVLYQRDYLSLLAKYGLEPPSQMLDPTAGGGDPASGVAGERGPAAGEEAASAGSSGGPHRAAGKARGGSEGPGSGRPGSKRSGRVPDPPGGAVERVRAAGRPRVVPDPPGVVPPLPADPELVRLAQVLLPAERAHRRGPATAKRAG